MFKKPFFKVLTALFLTQAQFSAIAMPHAPDRFESCAMITAASNPHCLNQRGLIRIRNTRAAAGNGGRANSCWSACFNDYNQCVETAPTDSGPKKLCVSRMKTCLAVCDHLSDRQGM